MNPPSRIPESLFYRQGDQLLWVEWMASPFSRQGISDYLDKARQVQARFPAGLSAVIVAPEFEEDIRELLALVRIPIRLFKYQETFSASQSAWWLEEVHTPKKPVEPVPEEAPPISSRLSREELREFVQLEIDMVRGKYNKA